MTDRPVILVVAASSRSADVDIRALGWQRAETSSRWTNPLTGDRAKYAFDARDVRGLARGTVLVTLGGWLESESARRVFDAAHERGFHIVGPEYLENRRGR